MKYPIGWTIFFVKALIGSSVLWAIGFWYMGKLPSHFASNDQLQREPRQTPTIKKPFSTKINGQSYQIDPVFDYEIWGLVVADHDSNSWKDLVHVAGNDFLNTKDICVIWGANILNPNLTKMSFMHGAWTCYVSTPSLDVWQAFRINQLSNNHLIPENPEIQKLISNSNIGDEIHISGQLVNYSINGGPPRKTSVIRTDIENGACEIVYVTNFETMVKNNQISIRFANIFKFLSFFFLIAVLTSFLLLPLFLKKVEMD